MAEIGTGRKAGRFWAVVEDHPTRQEIRRRFGEKVAAIVDGCTDAEVIPKPPWLERKKQHLDHLRQATPEVIRVSAADKLHNARAVLAGFRQHGNAIWGRFKGGRDGTLWLYRRLVEVLREAVRFERSRAAIQKPTAFHST